MPMRLSSRPAAASPRRAATRRPAPLGPASPAAAPAGRPTLSKPGHAEVSQIETPGSGTLCSQHAAPRERLMATTARLSLDDEFARYCGTSLRLAREASELFPGGVTHDVRH